MIKEIQRIKTKNNGELPKGDKTVIRVSDIENPREVLENFKSAVIAILKNPSLKNDNKKWEKLFPPIYIKFVNLLDDEDYKNDELVYSLQSIIEDMQELKLWEWFSSKVEDNSFEVIVTGNFLIRFVWFIHFQNIPLSKISIKQDSSELPYLLEVIKDVTTYKNFEL